MTHRRILFALPLLVLSLLCSGALAQSPGDDRGDFDRPDGAAVGLFDAPASFRPGSLAGLMLGVDGEAKFALEGVVFPGGPFGHGILAGHATRLVGPGAGTKVPMHGVWVSGRGGRGQFRAFLLRHDDDGDGPGPLVPFIEIRAGYRDRNGAVPPPGTFMGKWERLP